jgi:hypothetical protein
VVSVLVVVVLVVGMVSLVVFSLLDVLHLVLNTMVGGVVSLSWRGATTQVLLFVAFVLLQRERGGSLVVVALVGETLWIVLTSLLSKWLDTSFTPLVLTPVLSRLFTHVLAFEFQVGDLRNVWLIDSGCSRHVTGDKG